MVIIAKQKDSDIIKHMLVPKHSKISEKEKKDLLEQYKITQKDLPRIHISDPAISHLELTTEDIIKVERPSATSKTTFFYRRVVK